jgi:hypothetical protein
MARFIATQRGSINLDIVARVIPGQRQPSYKPAVYVTTDGERYEGYYSEDDVERLTAPVIPADATLATVIYMSEEEGEDQIFVEEDLILGWRDLGDYREPVFIEEISANGTAFLQYGGRWHELTYGGSSFETLDDVKKAILERSADDRKIREKIAARQAAKEEAAADD